MVLSPGMLGLNNVGNFERDCDRYWAHADYIPLEDVVRYWCEKTGYQEESCKRAKHSAIVAACTKGEIEYERADGRRFDDPPIRLASMGVLLIERKSFDEWVAANFEEEQKAIPTRELTTKEMDSIACIFAALCEMAAVDYKKPSSAAVVIENQLKLMGLGTTQKTIEKYLKWIPEAAERRGK